MNQTLDHQVPDAAAEPTASLASTTSEPHPPWCTSRTGACEGTHSSQRLAVPLSLAPALEPPGWLHAAVDEIDVSVWQDDGKPATVDVHHVGTEPDLPDLTPDEADQLALNLMRAARLARQTGAAVPPGCPPWCTSSGHGPGDGLHMGEMLTVPCAVTKLDDLHFCGYTKPSDPAFAVAWCDVLNFAQLVDWPELGQALVEVGHGDDLLPPMTIDAAELLAAHLTELVLQARKAVTA
jgi:hypothetical protein